MDDPGAPIDRDLIASPGATRLQTLAEVMRRVRPRFHCGLVDWYRDAADPRGPARLAALFGKVKAGLGSGVLADLFALAEILAAALRDGRLGSDPGTRSLMGQLDWVLKPLVQQPPAWPEADARALIDRLLDLLAGLEPGDDRVLDLLAVYRSSEPIRGERGARSDRPASSAEAGGDRDDGRLAELVAAEELLERIDRGAFVDPAALDAAYAAVHEVVGVLDPTDAWRLAPRLAGIADQVKALVSADSATRSTRLESLAVDLLAFEAILQTRVDERSPAETPPLAPGMDPTELTLAGLGELDRELLGVTEALAGPHETEEVSTWLDRVVTMLARIAGVLRVLGRDDLAALSAACADRLRRRGVAPDAQSIDAGSTVLDEALACLRREIGVGLAGGHLAATPTGCAEYALIALEQTSAQTPERSVPTIDISSEAPSLPRVPVPGETIAPELMEIFLEEIDEEIASARDRLACWSLDPRDATAITGLKRNFAVVKGSGLLVGARRVAEVAEAVEGLLVRVTAQPMRDPAATSFIAEVLDQLPALVHGATEDCATLVEALVARARQIAQATTEDDLAVDGWSALVSLDKPAGIGDALQIPIEDLLDTFEDTPETPRGWVLPDDAGATWARSVSGDVLGLSDQASEVELDLSLFGPVDPAAEPMSDPRVAPSSARRPEGDAVSPVASLVEQVAEMARYRAELDATHAQMVAGLNALDLGLARLRDLVDRLASARHPTGEPLGEVADGMGEAIGLREFCGRVGEILDDLESVRHGLIADREASDAPRARQAKLLEAVSDALVKLDLESRPPI
jgi:chemosensory pili system protein ChpA (sensor histidine kinase/response regulator)